MNADVDRLWNRPDGIPGVPIHDLPDPDTPSTTLTHERLVTFDLNRRQLLRGGGASWRLMTFSRVSDPMRHVRLHPSVSRWLTLI